MFLVGNSGGAFGPDLPQACVGIISDMEETKKHFWVVAKAVDTNRHKVTSDAYLQCIPLPSANTDFVLCVLFVFGFQFLDTGLWYCKTVHCAQWIG